MWNKASGKGVPGVDEPGSEEQALKSGSSGSERTDEVIAFVGKGVEFKGTVIYSGTVRIDGHLEGEIDTQGVLIVGEEAVINAKITAGTIVSQGKIKGDIVAKEKIRLLAPAVMDGSVTTPSLSMEEGVLFNGNLDMKRPELREVSREVREARDSLVRSLGEARASYAGASHHRG
jgi:cytoskeletal protein CcmA (bactofilin family)